MIISGRERQDLHKNIYSQSTYDCHPCNFHCGPHIPTRQQHPCTLSITILTVVACCPNVNVPSSPDDVKTIVLLAARVIGRHIHWAPVMKQAFCDQRTTNDQGQKRNKVRAMKKSVFRNIKSRMTVTGRPMYKCLIS